jgi:hypothetical protein
MQLTLPTATELEIAIPATVGILWSAISGSQIIAAKLRAAKCLVCDRPVRHHDQAQDVRAVCHEDCYQRAKLITRA